MSTPSHAIVGLPGLALTISGSIGASGSASIPLDDMKTLQSEILLLAIMSSVDDKRKVQALLLNFMNGVKAIGPQWSTFVEKYGLLGKIHGFPIV